MSARRRVFYFYTCKHSARSMRLFDAARGPHGEAVKENSRPLSESL